MPVLEARASLFAVKHALRRHEGFHRRHLVLSDSISAICALDRGRGKSFGLRRVTQQVGALLLGSGSSCSFRWIPSEWNPASHAPSQLGDGVAQTNMGSSASWGKAKSEEKLHEEPCHEPNCSPEEVKHGGDETHGSCKEVRKDEGETEHVGRGWNAGRCFGGSDVQAQIPGMLEQIGGVHKVEGGSKSSTKNSGSSSDQHAQSHVQGGREFVPGTIHGSSNLVQAPLHEVSKADVDPVSETSVGRLEEDRPSSTKASSALRSGGAFGQPRVRPQHDPGRSDDAGLLRVLPQARGSLQTAGDGFGASCFKKEGGQTGMELDTSSNRVGSSIQSCGVRRDRGVRFARVCSDSRNNLSSDEARPPTQESAPVFLNRGKDEWCDAKGGGQVQSGTLRSSPSISASTRGCQQRFYQKTEVIGKHSTKGPLEVKKQPEKIPKGWQASAAPSSATSRSATKGRKGRRKTARKVAWPALDPTCPPSVKVFLEIFSGSGRLGRAVGQATGWVVLLWDITLGANMT